VARLIQENPNLLEASDEDFKDALKSELGLNVAYLNKYVNNRSELLDLIDKANALE
jgi:hypothetical protein